MVRISRETYRLGGRHPESDPDATDQLYRSGFGHRAQTFEQFPLFTFAKRGQSNLDQLMAGQSAVELRRDGGCYTGCPHGDHGFKVMSERAQVVQLFSAQLHEVFFG